MRVEEEKKGANPAGNGNGGSAEGKTERREAKAARTAGNGNGGSAEGRTERQEAKAARTAGNGNGGSAEVRTEHREAKAARTAGNGDGGKAEHAPDTASGSGDKPGNETGDRRPENGAETGNGSEGRNGTAGTGKRREQPDPELRRREEELREALRARRSERTGPAPRRRDPNMSMLERQFQVQRTVRLGIIAAAAVLVLIGAALFMRRSGGTVPSGAGNGGTAAGGGVQSAGTAAAGFSAAQSAEAAAGSVSFTAADGQTASFTSDPAYSEQVTILGTGDNIIHEALYKQAKTKDGSYDFASFYRRVSPYIQAADLATVNQEGPLASELYPVSGYPTFNTPVQAADALIGAGFDILNFGNNHILDQGPEGIQATLEYMNSKGYTYCGAYQDRDDMYTMRVFEVNGIRVAFLGFLAMTNSDDPSSGSLPSELTADELDEVYDENLVSESYDERMEKLIRTAHDNADVVVVHCHWGVENSDKVTDAMKSLSQKLADFGADFIIGNHSHLVQQVTAVRRSSDGALVPVQYGGGNFVSGQKEKDHLLSILTTATFAKNPDTGDVKCTGICCLPVVTHYTGDRQNVQIYPLKDYTEKLAAENGVKTFDSPMSLSGLWKMVRAHVPEAFLDDSGAPSA